MIGGLLWKELRQHAKLILFILMLMALGLELLSHQQAIVRAGGLGFSVWGYEVMIFVPLTCLVLANALIAGEFRHKTQLFLEGLPMPRWMMVAVKYFLGLATIWGAVVITGAAAWTSSGKVDALTPTFVELLVVKSLGWAWFCWAVCFAHAFLGRYRLPAAVAIVAGFFWADKFVMIARFGPFDLINNKTFAFERSVWPVESIWTTLALIAGITVLGFSLGLFRDATLATMLSEKMSGRERIIFVLILGVGFIVGQNIQNKLDNAEPLHLPGDIEVSGGGVTVSSAAAVNMPTTEEKTAMRKHAAAAASLLSAVGDYLGCAHLPPVFLVHRRDFEKDNLESGDINAEQGFLVRLNMLETPPDDIKLQTYLVGEMLATMQRRRLYSDTRGWIAEGFAIWWPLRDKVSTAQQLVALRADKKGIRGQKITAEDLERWLKFEEKNPDTYDTIAAVGMLALGEGRPEERRRFLGGVLGYVAPARDARASLHDLLHPIPAWLKSTTGQSLETLAGRWTGAMDWKEEVKP